mgnify:CR=1 FL=1
MSASDASLIPRRIIKETQRLLAEPVAGISATPYADNLRYFAVAIEGGPSMLLKPANLTAVHDPDAGPPPLE